MAINPMQRKARTSFLLGMVITLIITGAIIALLGMKLLSMIQANKKNVDEQVEIYVLTKDVNSGQTIIFDPIFNPDSPTTEDQGESMIEIKRVNKDLVPENAVNVAEHIKSWTLQDKEGNKVYIGEPNNQNSNGNNNQSNTNQTNDNQPNEEKNDYTLYIKIDGIQYEVKTEEGSGEVFYYIEKENERKEKEKEYLELTSAPMIAKVNMKANTVLTPDLIARGDSTVQDDVRKQEYNIAVLPADIATGDIVDIRIRFPSGQDYIVVPKKTVEIPVIDGIDSADTFFVNLSEDETLSMSSAIIEAAQVSGSEIYLNRYTDPGLQKASEQNYIPKVEVLNELRVDKTALERAKAEILGRCFTLDSNGRSVLNEESRILRQDIDNQINNQADSQSNIETSVQESITKAKEARTKYVESLSAPAEE